MRIIYYLFIGAGVLLLFGTAGASDCGSITVREIIGQFAVAWLLISYGIKSLKLLERRACR